MGSGGRRRPAPLGRRVLRWSIALLVLAAIAGAGVWRYELRAAREDRRETVQRFAAAWERGDTAAMWRTLTPAARGRYPQGRFVAMYRKANRNTGVRSVQTGPVTREERSGRLAFGAVVRTAEFGALRGTLLVRVSGAGETAGLDWVPALRLPGLRANEEPGIEAGRPVHRGAVLRADGLPVVDAELRRGLERLYAERLRGHPAARLTFGLRRIATIRSVPGRSVRTTLRPRVSAAATEALGGKLGGVAVLRPRDGAVLGLAGLAVSAPQPPGSTFKIVTAAAALTHRVATPSTRFPVRTSATLSGVRLRNAGGEACGGTLTEAFIESCNSVFAPLGARVGAKRLVAMARRFGFGETPRVPGAKPSAISAEGELRDALAVGSAAIGQEKDLATPLEMATVAATIGSGGRRARPRIATHEPVVRRRVVSRAVAHQIRAMMVGVVRSGTGTAAALPGVSVAGKTGTAELRPNSRDPKDADAWFVAFAPAEHPRVAVAVLVVGAGFGGTAAAPIARRVLAAAL